MPTSASGTLAILDTPDEWSVRRLGGFLKVRHGKSQHQVVSAGGKYPILATSGEIGRTDQYLSTAPSVLIGRKGTIDRPQFVDTPFWTIDTLFWTEISPEVDVKFVYYLFGQIPWRSFNEATGVPSLNANVIENIEVLMPPVGEQRLIAEALTDVDELIKGLERLITKKRDVARGTAQTLVLGSVRLPGFETPWRAERLGQLLAYEQPTKYLVENPAQDSGEVPVLTAGATFLLGFTGETHGLFDRLPVILFDDFTTASKWVTFPFKVKSSACKMLSLGDDSCDLRFLFAWLQLLGFTPGGHMRHWISTFGSLEVMIPQLREQQAIAEVLTDMDAEINALEKRVAKTRDIKTGMAQELLFGRTRLV